jgi:hypothetical protein
LRAFLVHGSALAYDSYLHGELAPVVQAGFHAPIAEGFARFVSAADLSEKVDEAVAEELRSGKSDPFDTHARAALLRSEQVRAKRAIGIGLEWSG